MQGHCLAGKPKWVFKGSKEALGPGLWRTMNQWRMRQACSIICKREKSLDTFFGSGGRGKLGDKYPLSQEWTVQYSFLVEKWKYLLTKTHAWRSYGSCEKHLVQTMYCPSPWRIGPQWSGLNSHFFSQPSPEITSKELWPCHQQLNLEGSPSIPGELRYKRWPVHGHQRQVKIIVSSIRCKSEAEDEEEGYRRSPPYHRVLPSRWQILFAGTFV